MAERVAAEVRPVDELSQQVGRLLGERGMTLAVAESCTGGALGDAITDVAGSSRYFLGGVIAYSDAAKEELLGVPHEMLATHGAVSAQVVVAMAEGARRLLRADLALAVTGIAGPGGGTAEKPVGLVYIALASSGGSDWRRYVWSKSRIENKHLSVQTGLGWLVEWLGGSEA